MADPSRSPKETDSAPKDANGLHNAQAFDAGFTSKISPIFRKIPLSLGYLYPC